MEEWEGSVVSQTQPEAHRAKRVVKSADQRRNDIMDAALRVFAAKGFESCTVDDIAAAAGAGKGTFYRQFDSKDHVLGAAWERYVGVLLSTAQHSLEATSTDGWVAALEATFGELIAIAIEHSELHRIVYGSANGSALDMCRKANEQVVEILVEHIAQGAELGLVTCTHPTLTLRVLYQGLHATLDALIAADEGQQLEELPSEINDLLHQALGIPATR